MVYVNIQISSSTISCGFVLQYINLNVDMLIFKYLPTTISCGFVH